MVVPVTVIVLTLNEEANLTHCLRSVVGWATDVFVLDSGSTDQTLSLAEAEGACLFHRPFDNYAAQRNYAVEKLPIQTEWILFLDADESLTPELREEVALTIDAPTAVNGYFIAFKFIFLNRWIRYGGYYPTYILRLFRREAVQRIDRVMDEQVLVAGEVGYLTHPFIHNDRKPVQDWFAKHARYARFQVADLLKADDQKTLRWADAHNDRDRKRWVKEQLWGRVPALLRPFIYFIYRYVFQAGFLDGKAGFIYHFSHAFLYQFMISAVYIDEKQR